MLQTVANRGDPRARRRAALGIGRAGAVALALLVSGCGSKASPQQAGPSACRQAAAGERAAAEPSCVPGTERTVRRDRSARGLRGDPFAPRVRTKPEQRFCTAIDTRAPEGEFRSVRRDGTVAIAGQYRAGQPTGRWIAWDRAGRVISIVDHGEGGEPVTHRCR